MEPSSRSGEIASLLDSLLSPLDAGARVASLGAHRATELPASRHPVPTSADELGGTSAGSCNAVLWWIDDAVDLGQVADIPRILTPDGLLIAIVATQGPNLRGSLPAKQHALPRWVLALLSEHGFLIHHERRVVENDREVLMLATVVDDYLIRSYRTGDEDAILRLFPTCFHIQRSLDHWRWKYLDNPYGELMISMAFSPSDELAAHYASYPTPFWAHDTNGPRELLALQMGDTMTDPRFRDAGRGNRGLLPRTVRHFFGHHRDGRYGFYYGFNTGPIQRFCVRFIGGSKIGPVGYWTRDLDPETEPPWDLGGYRVERIRTTDRSFDRFFARVASHYGFLVHRDARWLDWRYLRCPDAEYVLLAATRWGRLVGWSVFRRRDDRLVWGDALFHPRHAAAAESLLAEAVQRPELAGARQLEAWFSPRPDWWNEHLPSLGFVQGRQPDGLGMVALEDGEDDAIERLKGMYYTMGDGDLF